ncbi:ligand-binding protein SH3 [Comamonas serinivorans]|uniref:Ligand-binding protein SH3 n=1 Tax=Comamonas serinivorans TaxID=1082851 RepID=A0A1Y0EK88_9BURK|nr:SH3 domain-containing protein [Comamonas serinivorans]ARU03779.1 ligand-binding protein SH3 [Comamonas serinivorans]
MAPQPYLVIEGHVSEYPEPITFEAGALLTVGETYQGPEGWDNWLFCETPGQPGGWVPRQILEMSQDTLARARESYTARELEVQQGDVLWGSRVLNGWVWCDSARTPTSGWVPLAKLQALHASNPHNAGGES